jgi:hypothetical protein
MFYWSRESGNTGVDKEQEPQGHANRRGIDRAPRLFRQPGRQARSNMSADIANRAMSEDSRGKAIEPGSLPIEDPCQHGRDHTGEAAAEDVGQIVSADKNT